MDRIRDILADVQFQSLLLFAFILVDLFTCVTIQAENRETGILAALKRVPIQDETELEDFMVEIDILSECKHPNIVGLHQAFFFDSALWVRSVGASLSLYNGKK